MCFNETTQIKAWLQNLQVSRFSLLAVCSGNINHVLGFEKSNVEKKGQIALDALAQVARASTKVQFPTHIHLQTALSLYLPILFRYCLTRYGESVALLPTISSPQRSPSVVDWMPTSGVRPSLRSAGVSPLSGMPLLP